MLTILPQLIGLAILATVWGFWVMFSGSGDKWYDPFAWRRPRYRVVSANLPPEENQWGELFHIVDRNGKVVGRDRWKTAHERCAALNKGER